MEKTDGSNLNSYYSEIYLHCKYEISKIDIMHWTKSKF